MGARDAKAVRLEAAVAAIPAPCDRVEAVGPQPLAQPSGWEASAGWSPSELPARPC